MKKQWQQLTKKLFLKFLENCDLECGELTIATDKTTYHFKGSNKGPMAKIVVKDDRFYPMISLQGDIGLGDAYMKGYYTTPSVTALVSFFIMNQSITGKGDGLIPSIQRVKDYIQHLLNDNRITHGRKNIKAHYDIGNDFYQTFLDPSMMYSSAIFETNDQPLEDAQYNKLDTLIAKAKICSKDHVLEIGSGWGAFAVRAVETTGCKVTTITLSEEQKKHVEEKIKFHNMEDRIKVELIDYRLVEGSYDKIVSIEMIEAVGHKHLSSYVTALEKLLAPNGLVVIQMISMPDYRYKDYTRSVDWIRKRIFPGGHLPSLTAFSKAMERNSKLHVENLENISQHYAETLLRWHDNFILKSLSLAQQKYGTRFIKMWEYYLLSCSAAFSTRYINTLVLTLGRDRNAVLDSIPTAAEQKSRPMNLLRPVDQEPCTTYQ